MICEILSVGTELLLGDIINTDAAYLARELASLGIFSYRQTVVGDNHDRLRAALVSALETADLVITTGGLGPTCDDITKELVAETLQLGMARDDGVVEEIKAYFERAGRPMTENNLKQAMVPEGAIILHNAWGTAPGLIVDGRYQNKERTVVLLPGPPVECEPMFETLVRPYLIERSGCRLVSQNVHLYGIGESAAESVLRSLMEASVNPTVAPYACEHEVRIRVTARAATEEEARRLCEEMVRTIRHTEIADRIFAVTEGTFETKNAVVTTLINTLRREKLTVATAESCTAGMISSQICDVPGASDVFLGSVVSYSNAVKKASLGVTDETLRLYGAVSEPCAEQMARGARERLGSDVSVSVTGIAGPGGGTPEKPVGTVCFGVAVGDRIYTETKHFNPRFDRAKIRRLSSAYAMMMLLHHINAR